MSEYTVVPRKLRPGWISVSCVFCVTTIKMVLERRETWRDIRFRSLDFSDIEGD